MRLHHDRHIIRQLQQRKADRRHVRSLGREAEGPRDIIGFGEPKHDRAPLNTAFALQLKQASIVLCNLGAMKQPIVSRRSDVMGGTAVFHGTRVPVQTLLDYLEAGESIDDFLEGFPSVTREHVIAFLEEAKDRVIEAAS